LIEIGSKTAEKNSAQTNRQTNQQTLRKMVTWPWTNVLVWVIYGGGSGMKLFKIILFQHGTTSEMK